MYITPDFVFNQLSLNEASAIDKVFILVSLSVISKHREFSKLTS